MKMSVGSWGEGAILILFLSTQFKKYSLLTVEFSKNIYLKIIDIILSEYVFSKCRAEPISTEAQRNAK
jgi:hypothetical protein